MKTNLLNKVLKLFIISFTLCISYACERGHYNESSSVSDIEISENYKTASGDAADYDALNANMLKNEMPKDLKIIKSATGRYKVKNVKEATYKIKKMANAYNAYISDLRFQNDNYKIENRFTIKIPQQYFDQLLDSLGSVVEFVDYENITTQDVTEEYIDVETRLKTKLEVKERYESILRKRAKTVEDILATEDKLRVIQEEIEASQGKLKYMSNKVAYSTVQIDLYETVDFKEEPIAYNKSFWSKSKDGLSSGLDFIENIVLAILHVWPLVIIGAIIFYFVKKRMRRTN